MSDSKTCGTEALNPNLKKLREVSADDLANLRVTLCLYDPPRIIASAQEKIIEAFKKLPDVTADDLAKVRGALCLNDPTRD